MPLSFYNNVFPRGVVLKEMTPVNSRPGAITASSIGSFWWSPVGQRRGPHASRTVCNEFS